MMTTHSRSLPRRSVLGALGAAPVVAGGVLALDGAAHAHSGTAEPQPTGGSALEARIRAIMRRPEFDGADWGMRFQMLDTGDLVHAVQSDRLFSAASTYKVFPGGTAFSVLGGDHRFRTRVYRTGPVVRGVLRGDLVVVAGGDPLFGGRVQPDGSVALPEPEHTYARPGDMRPGMGPIPGDPLQSVRDLVAQIAKRGVRRIDGRVLVDTSLAVDVPAEIGGLRFTMSPMMVNDNVVDITVRPGGAVGEPAVVVMGPQTDYLSITNEVTTVADAAAARRLEFAEDVPNPDGTHSLRITGGIPVTGPDLFCVYHVPEPARFAEAAFTRALLDRGIRVDAGEPSSEEHASKARHRKPHKQLAEYVSPALSEATKPMLKVSSNVHAGYWPYLVGAIAGGDREDPVATGEAYQRDLFEQAGLEPEPDGAADGRYTPDFFIRFLTHMAGQPYFPQLRRALPIMGRDGSLTDVQVDSPAAGHVHAKTGTSGRFGSDGGGLVEMAKALAGYIDLPDGRHIVFAEFVEFAATGDMHEAADLAGEALGEIATAVYQEMTS